MSSKDVVIRQIEQSLHHIAPLMQDDDVTDIQIYGPDSIHYRKIGLNFVKYDRGFEDEEVLRITCNQLARYMDRQLDAECPKMDGTLPDGSRINIVVAPVYQRGAQISIRRFPKEVWGLENLIKYKAIDQKGVEILREIIRGEDEVSILVSGGTGTGKTTVLKALAKEIPSNQIIVTCEDAPEIQIDSELWAPMVTKQPYLKGESEVTMRDLIKNSLRMSPHWIIVGEVRGEEIVEMVWAFRTGHRGMGTIHADSTAEALNTAMLLFQMVHGKSDEKEIRRLIAGAIRYVVQLKRFGDNTKRIVEIARVKKDLKYTMSGNDGMWEFDVEPVYQFKATGKDERGKIVGEYV